MKHTPYFCTILFIFLSCNQEKDLDQQLRVKVRDYFNAWNKQDFESQEFSGFLNDTIRIWHNEKSGEGIESIFDPNSGWKQWDKAWNGTYSFDIEVINLSQKMIVGKFNEKTDFLKRLGITEGYNARVTYWFDENWKVKETLYQWDPNNRSMHEAVKPFVTWAMKNDSAIIDEIYLKDGFVPSTSNAMKWKELLTKFEATKK